MARVEIATQAELDALKSGDIGIVRVGTFLARGSSHVVAWGSSHVEAWGSSHVEAWGSSHVVARERSHVVAQERSHVVARGSSHVEAWGSSHVEAWGSSHVVARGSSHVVARERSHVVAWESSHVVAWESSHVVAQERSHVVASQYVAVHRHGAAPVVVGGVVIDVKPPVNAIEWAAFYGARITNGTVLVYKAVRDDYRSAHGFPYRPGTTVEAPDWDGGLAECGGGLHFSPSPLAALEFDDAATRFVACPVSLDDIRPPDERDAYPHKIKARRVVGPIFEVDRSGVPVNGRAEREGEKRP